MYERTEWDKVDPETEKKPPVSGRRLDNMDSQYEAIIKHWRISGSGFRNYQDKEARVESLSVAPTHAAGRLYFDETDNKLKGSADGAWVNITP